MTEIPQTPELSDRPAAAPGQRPCSLRRRWLLPAGLLCLILAFLGLWAGLQLASPGVYHTALGDVSMKAQPSWHGELDVFVPLADWGIRAPVFSAPLTLHIEPRTLDRGALIRAAQGNIGVLNAARHDGEVAARRALLRSTAFAGGGIFLGVLLAGLLLFAAGVRSRKWLWGLPVAACLVATAACFGTLLLARSTFNPNALSHPTFYARGDELPQLLNAAQGASRAGDDYTDKITGSLRGFASMLTHPTEGLVPENGVHALLASDLHNNALVLKSLKSYAAGKPVFFVGDFGNDGSAAEAEALAAPIAHLGERVIAVSGNHDAAPMMRGLAKNGATVLTRHGVLRPDGHYGPMSIVVDGLRVAGWDDPLQDHSSEPSRPERIFSFGQLPNEAAAVTRAQDELLQWFDRLHPRPDVVLVHQFGLANWLAGHLNKGGYKNPLTILTGHDHAQHIAVHGSINVVDAGTAGASGLYGVGYDSVGLGELHFATTGDTLEDVDLISIEPVSGLASAQRIPLTVCASRPEVCRTDNVSSLMHH